MLCRHFELILELGDSSEITITIVATITIPIMKLSRYNSFRVNVYILSQIISFYKSKTQW